MSKEHQGGRSPDDRLGNEGKTKVQHTETTNSKQDKTHATAEGRKNVYDIIHNN